jgi:hypothetical protein
VSATPVTAPQLQLQPPAVAPANVAAAPGNGQVTLTWNPVSDASTYRIYRAVSTLGHSVVRTRVTPVTLDDVFLDLTGKELRD